MQVSSVKRPTLSSKRWDMAPPPHGGRSYGRRSGRAHTGARMHQTRPPTMFPANSISGNLSRAAVKCKHAPATACAPAMGIVTSGSERNVLQGKKKASARLRIHAEEYTEVALGMPLKINIFKRVRIMHNTALMKGLCYSIFLCALKRIRRTLQRIERRLAFAHRISTNRPN